MNEFKRIRKSLGLTQIQAAEAMGVTQSAVSKIEGRSPRLSELQKLVTSQGGELKLTVDFQDKHLLTSAP